VSVFPVVTDKASALILSQLIGAARLDEITVNDQRPTDGTGGIVVKLRTSITAGSAVPVVADIMRLSGNSWTESGQTVLVRSATGAAVGTTTRVIARKVANFGFCVVPT
jgi:hypothetical protein